MENQVSSLKKTVVDLKSREELQLEEAFKEMVNFYTNLENDPINEYSETDSMNIDRCFFINPTEKTYLRLQKSTSEYRDQRGRSHLKLSHKGLSVDGVSPRDGARAKSSNHKTALDIPRLAIDKINDNYQHDLAHPAIMNPQKKLVAPQGSGRGSSRNQQPSQRNAQNISDRKRNPSFHYEAQN